MLGSSDSPRIMLNINKVNCWLVNKFILKRILIAFIICFCLTLISALVIRPGATWVFFIAIFFQIMSFVVFGIIYYLLGNLLTDVLFRYVTSFLISLISFFLLVLLFVDISIKEGLRDLLKIDFFYLYFPYIFSQTISVLFLKKRLRR